MCIDARLLPPEHALLQQLQLAMATPLRPKVRTSEVIRAGLIALGDRLAHDARDAA